MSVKWSLDGLLGRDMKSIIRHLVLPLVAGAGVAALQTAQTGSFDFVQMKGAVLVSVIAAVVRLLQKFCTDTTSST